MRREWPRPAVALADSSLEAACATLAAGEAPAVHGDRGGYYRRPGLIAICEADGLPRSTSRKGTSDGNARAEGFFGPNKQELFYSADWEGAGEFMAELDAWMRWFRSDRMSQLLGRPTPDEHRLALGYVVWVQEIVRSSRPQGSKSFPKLLKIPHRTHRWQRGR